MADNAFPTYPDLSGKAAIVTGGALGIGAAAVEALAAQGAKVIFFDRNEGAAASLVARLGGANVAFRNVDVSKLDALRTAIEQAADAMGGLHVLINNVGDYRRHELDEVDEAFWRHSMALNLDHAFFATKAALPWLSRGGGAVVNVGSIKGVRTSGGMIGYVTAKAAMSGLSRGLAKDLGAMAIRVNTIIPGMISTEGNQAFMPEETVRSVLERQCLKTVIQARDVAALALFLSSDESKMITGQDIHVDAGL